MADSTRAEAQEVFAQFLEDRDAGQATNIETLCAQHPTLEKRLRRLFDTWSGMESALDSGPSEPQPERRYRREHPIARGGMGEIVAVFDRELGRTVAMKTLREDDGPDARRVGRFVEEARITAQLEHPNIVPLHDIGVDADGRPFFTMTLIRGISLAELIKQERAEQPRISPRVLSALISVCEAAAFAHERGIVHRDLKPTNVMVGEFGEVYVVDWGLARMADADSEGAFRREAAGHDPDSPLLTHDGDIVGTPAYMSPEQVKGAATNSGPRVDVYSIGAMLYESLNGEAPYGGRSSTATIERLQQGPPSPVRAENAPPELVAICERAMSRDPASRYQSALALRDDLVAFRDRRVVSAYRTGAIPELRMWLSRNRTAATLAALTLLTLVVGIILVDDKRREAKAQARAAHLGYTTAADSVENLLTNVGIARLAEIPGATALREELLDEALELQQTLLSLRPNDPEAKRRVARAWNHVANLAGQTGDHRHACDLSVKAIALLETLLDGDEPELWASRDVSWDAALWSDLLANVVAQANHLSNLGEQGQAIEFLDSYAARIARRRQSDLSHTFLVRTAEYHRIRSHVYQRSQRIEEATQALERSIAEHLLDIEKNGPTQFTTITMARARASLGGFYNSLDRTEEAGETFRLSIDALTPLVQQEPPNLSAMSAHHFATRAHAGFLFRQKERALAMDQLRAAVTSARRLTELLPDISRHRLDLGISLGRLGGELYRERSPDTIEVLDDALSALSAHLEMSPESDHGRRVFAQVARKRVTQAYRTHDGEAAIRLSFEIVKRCVADQRPDFLRYTSRVLDILDRDKSLPQAQLAAERAALVEAIAAQAASWTAPGLAAWLAHKDFNALRELPGFPPAGR